MKKLTLLSVLCLAIAFGGYRLGLVSTHSMSPAMQIATGDSVDQVLYWEAPMDRNFRRDKPGLSPMGMDLVPVYANQQHAEENTVTVSPSVIQTLGLRTGEVTIDKWSNTTNTVGHTTWDEGSLTSIYSRSEGWLETFNILSVGDSVSAGDTLFEIYSPTLVSAQKEYVDALRSGHKGLVNASKKRLVALGVEDELIRKITSSKQAIALLPYHAKADSIVTSLFTRKGNYVMPNTLIGTLAAADTIWLEANVLEAQSSQVKVGDNAKIQFTAFPGTRWNGTVNYIYPMLDPVTRTLRLRIALPNRDFAIKAGMFADITLQSNSSYSTLQIPKEAVIHAGGGNRVVLQNGDGSFSVRPVVLGRSNQDSSEILSGLIAGETVVTSAQFLIDSEANGSQVLARLDSLGNVSGTATIEGFPQLGQVRLSYQLYGELGEPNTGVLYVSSSVNLAPYNKGDRVYISLKKDAEGQLTLVDIRPAAMEMAHD
ncbi:MAG: Cu(I)/Ag(I) efflux system membrane fusion protein [Pseudoalteromonas tetraodonis]|jgi:Cu(I)/Ag(I) efflux system membrane fusion protein